MNLWNGHGLMRVGRTPVGQTVRLNDIEYRILSFGPDQRGKNCGFTRGNKLVSVQLEIRNNRKRAYSLIGSTNLQHGAGRFKTPLSKCDDKILDIPAGKAKQGRFTFDIIGPGNDYQFILQPNILVKESIRWKLFE